jgi:phospholipid/cholesterol/gamma-HCH transport system permease protein
MTEKSFNQLCLQIGNTACGVCREFITFFGFSGDIALAAWRVLRRPRHLNWRSVLYHADTCGSDAVPIISLLGLLVGVILAFQGIVQLSRYGVEGYIVNLVGAVIVTELAPLLTAIVLAGRSGSAFASELGTMQANEEIDALFTLGFDPIAYLVFPKIVALVIVLPCLTIFADVCGIIGGMLISCEKLDISSTEYFSRTLEVVKPIDLFQGLLKSIFFGIIVAVIGCMKGYYTERDSQGIGRSATSAVVTGIFLIVLCDAIITGIFSSIT